jgi:PmbA protein
VEAGGDNLSFFFRRVFAMDYKILAKSLVNKCLKKGATAVEAYLEEGRELDINVRNGEVEAVKEARAKGVGLRVIIGGRMAFVDSSDFSEEALALLVDKAVALARKSSVDKTNILPAESGEVKKMSIYDPSLNGVSLESKISLTKKLEKTALSLDPLIKRSDGANYYEAGWTVYIENSEGISASHRESYTTIGASVIAEDKGKMQPGYAYSSARFFADLKKPEELAKEAVDFAKSLFGGEPMKSQEVPVVFSPRAGRGLLYGLVRAINGEQVLQKASFLVGMLNNKIASDLVTIIDDGTMDKGVGSRPVDGEGVATRKKLVVDKGVLKTYFYNTRAAAKAGAKSTGNASRDGYSSLPGIGHTNFYLVNGKTTAEEIVKGVKNGLYLMATQGGGVNPVTGAYSTGAMGVWIEDGKKTKPVANITLAGNVFDMLKGIDAVGNDLEFEGSVAAPTFRIARMVIGGL